MNSRGLLPLLMALALLLPGLADPPATNAQGREAAVRAHLRTRADPVEVTYRVACADCHGIRGDGQGPGARGFDQPATDFTKGAFKFRSTVGDVPAEGDIERSIRTGMSGTEMVPFGKLLTPERIKELAVYVRGFSPELADPEAKADPDEVVEIPTQRPFPRSAETVAAGRSLWKEKDCGDCHGEDGRGSNDEEDEWGRAVKMVSFLEGYYKSGPSDADLYRSIATGMKGTTMEGYRDDLSEEQRWQLVDYIRSLGEGGRPGPFGIYRWPLVGSLMRFFLGTQPSGFDYTNY